MVLFEFLMPAVEREGWRMKGGVEDEGRGGGWREGVGEGWERG